MTLVVGILLGLALGGIVFAALRLRQPASPSVPDPELQKAQFVELSRMALKQMSEDFLNLARGELGRESQRGADALDMKRQAVESAVQGLEKKLTEYQQTLHTFEQERATQYGGLDNELKRLTQHADQLQRTTANLTAVLGNSRVRGQWGQKMAEDILKLCGLQEDIHYLKEREITDGQRPDYTFLLPDNHRLFMDVKFPYDHYLRFAEAQPEDDQNRHKDNFIKSVRDHLREMERRAYGASDQSVDYTLIFIPNEQVYASVNEWMPQLIDECLQKKLILCGPWTLYAIVRIVHQAWQNYHSSTAIHEIVRSINGFLQDYGKFKERFGELGVLLEKLDAKYRDIAVTSAQRLDGKIRRIEEYRKGQNIPESLPDVEPLTLEQRG